jgi:hypothetical protein
LSFGRLKFPCMQAPQQPFRVYDRSEGKCQQYIGTHCIFGYDIALLG